MKSTFKLTNTGDSRIFHGRCPPPQKACVLCAFLLACLFSANATNYYVSTSTGHDSNSGLSAMEAWATLERANAHVFMGGDSLLLRRGDAFRGTLRIRQSGDPQVPIYIGAYGEGQKPFILGSEPVTSSWLPREVNGALAWVAPYDRIPSFLYCDDNTYHVARMPDGLGSYYHTYWPDLHPPGTHVSGIRSRPLLQFPVDISGAYFSIRQNGWLCQTRIVSSFDAALGQLNFSPSMTFEGILFDSTGFFLSNHIAFLNQPGEFYYHRDSNQLWMITGSYQPEPGEVEASVYNFGIFLDTSTADLPIGYLTIENIAFRFQAIAGISLSPKCHHIVIRHCAFEALPFGITAVQAKDKEGKMINVATYDITIEHNNITDAYRMGINLALSRNLVVRYNTVRRAGLIVNAAEWLRLPQQPYGPQGAAIECKNGQGSLIEYNRVDSCGQYGISISSNCIARYNIVKDACLRYMDCGGIYAAYDSEVLIEKNIVENVQHRDKAFPGSGDAVSGIYFDYNGRSRFNNVTIRNNTLIRASQGLGGWTAIQPAYLLHPKLYIEGNVSYANRTYSFASATSISNELSYPGGNVEFKYNKWVGFNQKPLWYWNNKYNNNSFWKTDSNYYFNPYYATKICTNKKLGLFCHSLSEWQVLGYDIHSRTNFVEISNTETRPPEVLFPIFVNETQEKQYLLLAPKCYLNLDSQPIGPILILEPFCSEVLVLIDDCALACIEPDTLAALDISDTSAVLYWSPVSGAHAYVVRFRPAADTVWTEYRIAAAQPTSWQLSGLSPHTEYAYTVQTICDTSGLFVSPIAQERRFFTQDTVLLAFSPRITPCPLALIWPNPTAGQGILRFHNPERQPFLFSIMNTQGQRIGQWYTFEERVNLYELANLAPGIYIYQSVGPTCASSGLLVVK